MKNSILLFFIMFGVLTACKEGDLSLETDSQFANLRPIEFSQIEFKSFADMRSWMFANGTVSISSNNLAESYFSINDGSRRSFKYSQCLSFTYFDNSQITIHIIIANNEGEIDFDSNDFFPLEYLQVIIDDQPIGGPNFYYDSPEFYIYGYLPISSENSIYTVEFKEASAVKIEGALNAEEITVSGWVSCL